MIFKRLIFTEKFNQLLERYNKYIFEVDSFITKIQIRWIVEKIFRVPVRSVNTLRQRSTTNRMNGFNRVKRAVVSVEKGSKIRLTLSENESALLWIY